MIIINAPISCFEDAERVGDPMEIDQANLSLCKMLMHPSYHDYH